MVDGDLLTDLQAGAAKMGLQTKRASYIDVQKLRKNAKDVSLTNSIPASHYDSRVPESVTRAKLGLRQGSDQAFWRNYYAGMAAKDTPTRNYHNMLANAANTPGDHQRYYANGKEPPWAALRKFAPGLANDTLYKFIPKLTLDDFRPKK